MAVKDFIEELEWRDMLFDATPGIREHLMSGMATGYIGFDPTAKSLTIGNYVQLMILTLFQKAGHRPVVLMGEATGRVGDPSGRDTERDLLSHEILHANMQSQIAQFRKLMDFDSDAPNTAIMRNNLDFYQDMNALDFLRIVGKNLTVNYMLSKESVKNRMESGISFTEFSYQLLQGYDFLCLLQNDDCSIQMGGSDQWGNITSGIEFIRRNTTAAKPYAVTTPLLTKSDGTKFGKSQAGNIWLDPELTSPYQFYQFWVNADDRDISKLLRYFSLKSREEITALEEQTAIDPNIVKRELGEELTSRIHSPEAYKSAVQASEILFNPKLSPERVCEINAASFEMISKEIPTYDVERSTLGDSRVLVDLLCETPIFNSKGEARRAVQGNAVSMNKRKVQSIDDTISLQDVIHDAYVLIENGKRNKFILHVT